MRQKEPHGIHATKVQPRCGVAHFPGVAVWIHLVLPIWDIQTQITENLDITALFTVISIARGYIFRRIFNWLTHRRQLSMTQIHRQLDMLEDRF